MNIHLDRRAPDLAILAAEVSDDILLTTDELAAWLGVHKVTIKRWRHQEIAPPAIRTGPRTLRYRKADVLAWLAERTQHRSAVMKKILPEQREYIREWEAITARPFLWDSEQTFAEAVEWNNGHMEDVVSDILNMPAPISEEEL